MAEHATAQVIALRTEETRNVVELTVIHHLRGWCHNGEICPICIAYRHGAEAERVLNSIIEGT